MFDIEYKGANSVIVSTKKSTLVTDPKLSVVGLKDVALKEAVEIASEPRFALNGKDARLHIEGPGEYEIGDFSIRGVRATRHIDTDKDEPISTVYRIEVGDVRVAYLGNIAGTLSEDQLEALGVIDMVILPVGGGGLAPDATSAAHLVRQIDPKVVIPVHYADDAIKYEMPQDSVETFVKELGAPVEKTAKYKVKAAASLPPVLTIIEITRS
jgi:L-ascorbate metabolism protein UlaG (beta-lactamase superfamily)